MNTEAEELRQRAERAYAEFRVSLDGSNSESLDALCKLHPSLAQDLRQLHDNWKFVSKAIGHVEGRPIPDDDQPSDTRFDSDSFPALNLERLTERERPYDRYRVERQINEGGQGAILKVWDEDLDRKLAMKVMHAKGIVKGGFADSRIPRALARFLEEAQITGQLDHPGIVPVHELGVDPDGHVYFTMKLVEGESLKHIIDHVHAGKFGWTRLRVLGVLLKVCEAAAYAHAKGVLHRDIKPSNVMVGRFGEVYLMDWGLAKVVGREEAAAPDAAADPVSEVRSIRNPKNESSPSPLVTGDQTVVGTPAYMPPEQALGRLEHLGPSADVYSIGALLYQLLTGEVPYVASGTRPSNYKVLCAVQDGPPVPVQELAHSVAPELVSICEKAMERKASDRYPDVQSFGDDLRSFLENRVVAAYRTGAVVELTKWVQRNRASAAAAALVVLVLIVAGFAVAGVERNRREGVQRDLDEELATSLMASAQSLGPIHPDSAPRMESWITEAELLAGKLPEYRAELLRLGAELEGARRKPWPVSSDGEMNAQTLRHLQHQIEKWNELVVEKQKRLADPENSEQRAELEQHVSILVRGLEFVDRQVADLDHRMDRVRDWQYVDEASEQRWAALSELVWNLDSLLNPPLARIDWVRSELLRARELESASTGMHGELWARAIASIGSVEECPLYEGLIIEPQLGLVPLDRNAGGLWEFWLVLSGTQPQLRLSGGYSIQPESGIVLVLIPGGEFNIGAQIEDPLGANYCPPSHYRNGAFHDVEGPVRRVALSPYFLSKYELTQGQWQRLAETNPSVWFAGSGYTNYGLFSATHPVEQVTWTEAREALGKWNLTLPTEAQWEVAARAQSEGPYFWGDSIRQSRSWVNFEDARRTQFGGLVSAGTPDDGWPLHAPVDTFLPNPWGLVSISGNVSEWCLDWFEEKPGETVVQEGSGLMVPNYSNKKPFRGGSYEREAFDLRVSRRFAMQPDNSSLDLGVRAARSLNP